MKIKENYVLRQVADAWVVVAVGAECVNFNGMLTLNDSGALLWNKLRSGCDRDALIAELQDNYEVDAATAGADVDAFLSTLKTADCLED